MGTAMNIVSKKRPIALDKQQSSLRVACAYRTVFTNAALFVTGVNSIDLLVLERVFLLKMLSGTDAHYGKT